MYIRILQRSWEPEGHSSQTDEVTDEYKGDVNDAFQVLIKSRITYDTAWIKDSLELFQGPNYKQDQDTIFFIHPMNSSPNAFFVQTTITAMALRNLHKKYNLFAVDMRWNNAQIVMSVAHVTMAGQHTHIESMAAAVAEFFDIGIGKSLLKPEQIHLVGWSYSGQLVGYIARYIYEKYKTKIATIVSIDPYASMLNEALIHVSANDAKIVHIYHSNSWFAGTRMRVGTADFVHNDGNIQPECTGKELFTNTLWEPNACSHTKAVQRLWYFILFPKRFVARKCPTWNHLRQCYCEEQPTQTLSFPITPDSTAKGTYFIRTTHTRPFGVGIWGASCSSEQRLLKDFKIQEIKREKILT